MLSELEVSSRSWHIRPAQAPDLAAAASLIGQSFYAVNPLVELVLPLINWGIDLDLQGRLREQRPGYQCFIAVQRQAPEVMGVVELEHRVIGPQLPYQPKNLQPYLSNLAVHPRYRRQGIAQGLLNFVEAWLLRRQHPNLYLHVLASNNPAQALYTKLGYGVFQEEPHWLLPTRVLLYKSLPSHPSPDLLS